VTVLGRSWHPLWGCEAWLSGRGRGWFGRSQLSSTLIVGCATGFRRPSPGRVACSGEIDDTTCEALARPRTRDLRRGRRYRGSHPCFRLWPPLAGMPSVRVAHSCRTYEEPSGIRPPGRQSSKRQRTNPATALPRPRLAFRQSPLVVRGSQAAEDDRPGRAGLREWRRSRVDEDVPIQRDRPP